VVDLGDAVANNPYRTWKVTVSTAPLAKLVTGTLTKVTIKPDAHGRAVTVTLTGTGSTKVITGEQFRSALGLRSTMVKIG
jgi:peptidoglycan hydrolase-like amidase